MSLVRLLAVCVPTLIVAGCGGGGDGHGNDGSQANSGAEVVATATTTTATTTTSDATPARLSVDDYYTYRLSSPLDNPADSRLAYTTRIIQRLASDGGFGAADFPSNDGMSFTDYTAAGAISRVDSPGYQSVSVSEPASMEIPFNAIPGMTWNSSAPWYETSNSQHQLLATQTVNGSAGARTLLTVAAGSFMAQEYTLTVTVTANQRGNVLIRHGWIDVGSKQILRERISTYTLNDRTAPIQVQDRELIAYSNAQTASGQLSVASFSGTWRCTLPDASAINFALTVPESGPVTGMLMAGYLPTQSYMFGNAPDAAGNLTLSAAWTNSPMFGVRFTSVRGGVCLNPDATVLGTLSRY